MTSYQTREPLLHKGGTGMHPGLQVHWLYYVLHHLTCWPERISKRPPEFKGKLVIDVPHQEWCGVFVLLTSQFLNALNIPYSSLNFCLVVNVFEDTERMEWNAISLKENLLGLKKRRL